MKKVIVWVLALFSASAVITACGNGDGKSKSANSASFSDAASRVYVAPGEHDEFYAFISGGFSGQLTVYGLPSGRLFRRIPVFSQDGEKGYGYSEESKP